MIKDNQITSGTKFEPRSMCVGHPASVRCTWTLGCIWESKGGERKKKSICFMHDLSPWRGKRWRAWIKSSLRMHVAPLPLDPTQILCKIWWPRKEAPIFMLSLSISSPNSALSQREEAIALRSHLYASSRGQAMSVRLVLMLYRLLVLHRLDSLSKRRY